MVEIIIIVIIILILHCIFSDTCLGTSKFARNIAGNPVNVKVGIQWLRIVMCLINFNYGALPSLPQPIVLKNCRQLYINEGPCARLVNETLPPLRSLKKIYTTIEEIRKFLVFWFTKSYETSAR
jgi:hypothetical protein